MMVRNRTNDNSPNFRDDFAPRRNLKQVQTLQNMSPSPGVENHYEQPYAAYEPLSTESHHPKPSDSSSHEPREYQLLDSQPDKYQVIRNFEEFIEASSPLSDLEESKYRHMTVQQKFKLMTEQKSNTPIHKARFYVDELKRNSGVTRKRRSWGRGTKEIRLLSNILHKLKSDLLFAPESFAEEFVSQACGGVASLINALIEIQRDQSSMNTTKKIKPDISKQFMQDEYDCLLCLKFSCKHLDGVIDLLSDERGMETVAECIYSSQATTRIAALQILTMCCKSTGGFQKVIRVTSKLRIKYQEEVRFLTIIGMLNEKTSLRFKIACVEFFNELWKCTQLTNAKVYVQFELEQAGFDPDLIETNDRQSGVEFEMLQDALNIWRKQYINAGDAKTDLQDVETRNTYLREEINRLNEQIRHSESKEETYQKSQKTLEERCSEFRERAAELQDTVEDLKHLYRNETGKEPDSSIVRDASKPLDIYGTIKIQREQQQKQQQPAEKQDKYDYTDVPDAPPIPKDLSATLKRKFSKVAKGSLPHLNWIPMFSKQEYNSGSVVSASSMPLPPVPPPTFLSQTVRKKVVDVKVNLPQLHWSVQPYVTGTIFEDIDDEAKLREIDFREFEQLFKLPTPLKSKDVRGRFERALLKSADQIVFVGVNRAKNMIITKRRINLTSRDIRDAIDQCDLKRLPGELAELLLKFQPTKDELKKLSQHVEAYDEMGEAEQFLFHMAQVERLESKLGVLAFIGVFDEIIEKVGPDIDVLFVNATKIFKSVKLKKMLEIVLAFGNYMNSNKKGYATGFKIESLAKLKEVKSTDKGMTLLQYLEEFVYIRYPELHDFYAEINVNLDRGVCYQAIYSDVLGLRKGLDLVKYEKDKQPTNASIVDFHERAFGVVARVADSFHNMESRYQSVCKLFGENYKEVDTDDIFKPLVDFAKSFQKAAEDKKRPNIADRVSYLEPVTPRHRAQQTPQLQTSPFNGQLIPRLDLSSSLSSSQNTFNQNAPTRFTFETTGMYANSNRTSEIRPMSSDEEIYDDVITAPEHVRQTNGGHGVYFNDEANTVVATRNRTDSQKGMEYDTGVPLGTPREPNSYANVPSHSRNGHLPVIMQNSKFPEQKGKLPRVPIDVSGDEYQTYYNVYNLKRKKTEKSTAEVLPNKPSISRGRPDSFTGAQVYEELPYEQIQKQPTQESKGNETTAPPVPPKTETKPAKSKMNGVHRALPSPPPLERGFSVQISDALDTLDRVLDAEVADETASVRL